ncbi:MAG: hypothetical protein H7222_01500 [Methylotenera sp.]|nr:hypothetical protein [Oligoflexia bacterium]
MAIFSRQRRSALVAAISFILLFDGCSTTQVEPLPEFPAELPPYVQVPHPPGLDLGDVRGLFAEKGAPDRAAYAGCDQDFLRLREKTQSKIEIDRGIRELVKRDPVKYHWCFYSKVLDLEDQLAHDIFIEDRQKAVVDHYIFLTPVARSFMNEFRDSRYLRWAVTRYRRVSEFVFYRKVEATPQLSSELIRVSNPFSDVRPSLDTEASILEKYGLIETAPAAAQMPAPPTTVSSFRPTGVEADAAIPALISPPSPSFGEEDQAARVPASAAIAKPAPERAAVQASEKSKDTYDARELEKQFKLPPD